MYAVSFDHRSVIGPVRDLNEDTFTVLHGDHASGSLAVVCDGMGGEAGGEIASRIVCETFFDYPRYREGIKSFHAGANRRRLERLIQVANRKVLAFVQDHPRYRGMGTTVSALVFLEDKIVLAHVGDSRIYRLRDGHLRLLTMDETLRAHLLQRGVLSPQQAAGHPSGHVLLQAVGASPRLKHIQSRVEDLADGDRYLVCSDGLSDLVHDAEIRDLLESRPFSAACDRLVDMALARGGRDNITVIAAAVQAIAEHRRAA
jgi:protein phosphatase